MATRGSAHDAAARLGLDANASEQQAQDLIAFLSSAPASLQDWAATQRRLAATVLAEGPMAPETTAAETAAPVPSAVARDFAELGIDEDEIPAATTASAPATASAPVKPVKPVANGTKPAVFTPATKRTRSPLLTFGAIAALVALVVMGVFFMSPAPKQDAATAGTSSSESPIAMSTPTPADPKMVAALEAKIKANPKDTLSMKALGELYNTSGEYAKAAQWQKRVTEITPDDVDSWLALGVAQFNGGDIDGADKSWTKASQLAPRRAEIWYNLGFLYYSKGDQAKASAAWQKVVDIDPKSDLAQTVSSHIKATNASAFPSATPSR